MILGTLFGVEVPEPLFGATIAVGISLFLWMANTMWRTSLTQKETTVILKQTADIANAAAKTAQDTTAALAEHHTRLVRVETTIWGNPPMPGAYNYPSDTPQIP